MHMKYAIIGSRTITDSSKIFEILDSYSITEIISGGAAGADAVANEYAIAKNLPKVIFFPDWEKYGRAAGPIRNKSIVDASDVVIAFWDGKSKGTLHSINYAKKTGKKVETWIVSNVGFSKLDA